MAILKGIVKAKKSMKYAAVAMRLKRLPEFAIDMMRASSKKDALLIVQTFQEGIRKNSFGLTPLSGVTVENKKAKGYTRPKTPLYGAGDSENNSYINALRIRKLKNGYKIFQSLARHHESGLPLRAMLAIHENGAIIKVTKKMRAFLHYINIHLRPDTKVVRIPPRPTLLRAFNRAIRRRKKGEDAKEIKRAMEIYVKTGKKSEMKKFLKVLKKQGVFDES